MRSIQTGWIRLMPPVLLLPLAAVPPVGVGRYYWVAGLVAMLWSAVRIVLFLIRVLWELADKKDSDPDMREILRSMLTVGVMLLVFCSLAINRQIAWNRTLAAGVNIQARCNRDGRCPETALQEDYQGGRNPGKVGVFMPFPVSYRTIEDRTGFVFELTLSDRDRMRIEGGRGRVLKWYVVRE